MGYLRFLDGCFLFALRARMLSVVSITLYESFVFMIPYSGGMSLGSIICIG